MIRRFVNVVAENFSKSGLYSLHRLDVSKHLFYESRAKAQLVPLLAEAQANTAAAEKPSVMERLEELPAPCVNIQPSTSPMDVLCNSPMAFFALLNPCKSEGKVIFMNRSGAAVLRDVEKQTRDGMPLLEDQVGPEPISFSFTCSNNTQGQEEDLYIFYKTPGTCSDSSYFRVLRWESEAAGWRWDLLPPPPFVNDFGYQPASFIYSFTVVDGDRTIYLSFAKGGIGTYCFDMLERKWWHASKWELPFKGRAEYIPDLKLWLGFDPNGYLCETRLNSLTWPWTSHRSCSMSGKTLSHPRIGWH
jgi:hypothetical protein